MPKKYSNNYWQHQVQWVQYINLKIKYIKATKSERYENKIKKVITLRGNLNVLLL